MEMSDSTAGAAAGIQAIDKGAVHRICSGQVVLNLATAIKELVENSIDAGATNIEVRLKDHGSELVEVIDNGSGVEPENFAGLTLKHHTSKLKDFSDLVNVDTFGFRGEALSSLCALSKLTIITCHKSAGVGTRLEYDHNGKLSKQSPCPRQTGMTVSVENVFSTLPVRHKEFHRNLKKEFTKAIQVLNAYCMISTGIRITCTNQVGKGKKNTVVSTGGNATIRENITNVFGAKQGQSLLELTQFSPTEEVFTEFGIKDNEKGKNLFEISGYLSSSEHGQGRSSSDRQYFFINSRPCDPQKISRLVNEVYHSYNRYQNPFVMMNITLAKESVDVNVTPDKRQIFIHEERLLLAIIKSSLIRLFEPKSSVYRITQLGAGMKNSPLSRSFPIKSPIKSPDSSNKKSLTSTLANLKRSFSSAFAKDDSEHGDTSTGSTEESQAKQRKLDDFVTRSVTEAANDKTSDVSFGTTESLSVSLSENGETTNANHGTGSRTGSTTGSQVSEVDSQTSGFSSAESDMLKNVRVNCYLETPEEKSKCAINDRTCTEGFTENSLKCETAKDSESSSVSPDKVANGSIAKAGDVANSENSPLFGAKSSQNADSPAKPKGIPVDGKFSLDQFRHRNNSAVSSPLKVEVSTNSQGSNHQVESVEILDGEDTKQSPVRKNPKEILMEESQEPKITFTEYDAASTSRKRREAMVSFSMEKLTAQMGNKVKGAGESRRTCRSFRAQISPTDNQAAETELQKEISKDMFKNMEILGQFNLGFIIVKLGRDLFIVDQHATDEKYNFETLQRETVIQGQKLIQPQNLELTSANECILLDNLDIFRKNGFEFLINEDGLPTERVELVTMPVSRNWTFGKDDIEELIFMLSDSPGVMCRPSRIRAMFASRACRKSIMIGTALNEAQMKKLVHHMGEIDQPWNCPHGRPTMRHLINLDMLPD